MVGIAERNGKREIHTYYLGFSCIACSRPICQKYINGPTIPTITYYCIDINSIIVVYALAENV